MRENLNLLHVINKGADQPAHPHILISAFFIRKSIVVKLAPCKISIFKLVSVAEQAGLNTIRSEQKKKVFSLRLFDLILYIPVNNFSVMSGQVFLG